ncbi:putative membrane protein [Pseudozyma hubeiensis]|nr:putative membrane protein [Pseudozyma hubeiensis]
MTDKDPLRSPLPPSDPPLSPRAIQFADQLHPSPRPSRDASPTKLGVHHHHHQLASGSSGIDRQPSPDPLRRPTSPAAMAKDYGAVPRDASATSTTDPQGTPRAGYRASGPGRINLPPSPYVGTADLRTPNEDDSAGPSAAPRARAPSMSPSTATSAQRRRMSFKRRAPSVQQRQNFLQRASMGVFPRKLSIAGSDAGADPKHLRRVHTTGGPSGGADGDDDDGTIDIDALIASAETPAIPRMLPTKADPFSTPIPALPFIVLCLVCFGEFSSAGVAGPFLFFMIEDFGVGGESDVGFWAGIVSASFFFAQFLTSLMWASVADKRGRRFVLAVSLLGNAITMMLFGTSQNLGTAIFIRLAQGFFNGAVGVAKGAIRDITDETNEGRAYALMGFCWGMGGIIGPILGGLLEHPVQKLPGLFGKSQLFQDYPYLLPCLVAAAFTAVGSVLTLFIGYDGGPRTGAIQLPEKGDIERAANHVGSFGRSAGQRISGYFNGSRSPMESDLSLSRNFGNADQSRSGHSTPDVAAHSGGGPSKLTRTFTQQVDYETGGPPSPVPTEGTIITHNNTTINDSAFSRADHLPRRQRLLSRTEERQRAILGSAYGYDRRMSRASAAPTAAAAERAGPAARTDSFSQSRTGGGRNSFSSTNQYAPDFEEIGQRPGLSFAQRFLLAQDDSVFTISDLWVAAAINGDEAYEDVFEDDEDEMDTQSYDDGSVNEDSIAEESIDEEDEEEEENEASALLAPRHLAPRNFAQRKLSRAGMSDAGRSYTSSARPKSMRRTSGNRVPSLYANTGVEGGPLSPAYGLASPSVENVGGPLGGQQRSDSAWDPTLAGIPESHSNRNSLSVPHRSPGGASPGSQRHSMAFSTHTAAASKPVSLFTLLPTIIIAHYGLMAFHSSTFDQVFMAFLVTPEPSGGLGLTASHYAQLIAAMAFCQLIFQFVFYPRVGPPQGKLSHLAMLRLGTAIYLPCYTLFPLLRGMLHPDTDGFVMAGMIFFASLRWLANVCAFTAVSVLINAMTPPHLTPLANGLAQTTSSAARFVGPIIGGLVWAKGIDGGPETHNWPFNYHLGFWFVGIAGFVGFLFTWRIK